MDQSLSPLFSKKNNIVRYKNKLRRVFLYKKNQVFAGGLLITYKNSKKKKKTFLVNETKNNTLWTSDLGGKVDMDDTCIFDTIAREVWEESSARLFGKKTELGEFKELLKILLDNSIYKFIYIPNSKYFLVDVLCDKQLPEDCMGLVCHSMTRFEKNEGCIEREFMWVKSHELGKLENVNPRIKKVLKTKINLKI